MRDLIVSVCLVFLSVVIWWPTRFEPYHWDSAGFINTAAENLLLTNFAPLIAVGSDFAHPPMIPFLLALIKTITSVNLLYAHLLTLPFLILLALSAYSLGKSVSNPLIGLGTAFWLLFTPVVLAEAGIIYIDLPVAALCLASAAAFAASRRLLAAILLTLAVLTKETAWLYLPFFLLYPIPSLPFKKRLWLLLVPLCLSVAYFIYHHAYTGWWLAAPSANGSQRLLQSVNELTRVLPKIALITFSDQLRFLISLPLLLSLYLLVKGRLVLTPLKKERLKALVSVLGLFFIFYIVTSEYAPRYLILALPLVYLLTLSLVQLALSHYQPKASSLYLSLYIFLVALAFTFVWRPNQAPLEAFDFRPPSDLRYQDYTRLFRQAGGFLSGLNYRPRLVGSFPENLYFTTPSVGYLSQPLEFIDCSKATFNPASPQIVIIHPFSPGQKNCQALINSSPATLLQTFTSHDKWLKLYAWPASESALPLN